jgi:hypothetical protein
MRFPHSAKANCYFYAALHPDKAFAACFAQRMRIAKSYFSTHAAKAVLFMKSHSVCSYPNGTLNLAWQSFISIAW